MTDSMKLQQMRDADITETDPGELKDICDVRIDRSLTAADRMQSYLKQIGNPYCFRCGGTPVKIRFAAEDKTLRQELCSYFMSLERRE